MSPIAVIGIAAFGADETFPDGSGDGDPLVLATSGDGDPVVSVTVGVLVIDSCGDSVAVASPVADPTESRPAQAAASDKTTATEPSNATRLRIRLR
jgi:hypothetical protein